MGKRSRSKTELNQYGLGRHISEAIKREVRRRSGFACIICRNLPKHYDHFDPPWTEAREHRAEGIALLCPTHHTERGSKAISVDHVRSLYLSGQENGWSCALNRWYPDQSIQPRVIVGNWMSGQEWKISVASQERPIFWIRFERELGWIFDGEVRDNLDKHICTIVDNEFQTNPSDVFDLNRTENRVEWKSEDRVVLGVTFDGPNNALIVTHLDMRYGSIHARVDKNGEYQLTDGAEDLCGIKVTRSPDFPRIEVGVSLETSSSNGTKNKFTKGIVRDVVRDEV